MPIIHRLKTLSEHFWPVVNGVMPFVIAYDQGSKVGDLLELLEFDPESEEYTSNKIFVRVTYVTNFAQKEGYVVMGITPVEGGPMANILGQVQRDLGGRVQIGGLEFETEGSV